MTHPLIIVMERLESRYQFSAVAPAAHTLAAPVDLAAKQVDALREARDAMSVTLSYLADLQHVSAAEFATSPPPTVNPSGTDLLTALASPDLLDSLGSSAATPASNSNLSPDTSNQSLNFTEVLR
jgi:hypothetical protein